MKINDDIRIENISPVYTCKFSPINRIESVYNDQVTNSFQKQNSNQIEQIKYTFKL